ncbi:hypothetical protein [Nocardia cyriacigeorgica]|uniref:hypothetical protein n=1 Tax=Nocardia cyriacigeorgica TaxID=135487 RepID=UPI002017220E|nr:hypothetical protein [Nocardia cyriacigeorgica]
MCQLESEAPIRAEFARWLPQLVPVFERFDQRPGNPPELAIAPPLASPPLPSRLSVAPDQY